MYGISRKSINDFDWPLLGMALLIATFSVVEIASAQPEGSGDWSRQLGGIFAGLLVLTLVTVVDYRRIVGAAPLFYGAGIVLLLFVFTPLGKEVNGNRSWLYFGSSFGFQPSEFAKIFTLLLLTYYLAGVRKRPLDRRTTAIAIALWAVPTALVYLEHDTGSTLSFTSFLICLLFLCGLRWTWVAAGAGALALVVMLAVPYIKESKDYKAERIKAVYWPELASKSRRYQNEQAEIAVGSGGLIGKGINNGSQGALGFLPEVHTDFIFAVAGEETGFLGSSMLLTLYLLIVTRLIQIARTARDRTGLLLVAGFAALLLYHVTVSVGMVVRLLPIMGIPLPLMSFGRSSVIATFFGLGLAMNVRLRRFVN